MSSRISFTLASLAGAFAIHFVFVACSANGGGGSVGAARADTPTAASTPASCKEWQVKTFFPSSISWQELPYTDDNGKAQTVSVPSFDPLTLPAGWEPMGAENSFAIVARHCLDS